MCQSRSTRAILAEIDSVVRKYTTRGFEITAIHADNEFASIRDYVLPIHLHVYGKDEHVGVIERAIRVIKERCRCVCHAIPYKYYTKLMLRSLIAVVIRWINAFPSKGSISSTMSPAMIVEGKTNPDMNNNRISFGSHAFVFVIIFIYD